MDRLVLSHTPQATLCATGRVVKRTEADCVATAAALVQRLHTQHATAEARIEQARAEAHARGLAEGRAQGHAELATALARAERARHALLQSLAPMLAELVAQAAGRLLADAEPARHLGAALAAVQGQLRQARFARWVVAPGQVAAAQAALARLGPEAQIVSVQVDTALADDACRFETDLGIALASWPAQLQALQQTLEQGLQQALQDMPQDALEARA